MRRRGLGVSAVQKREKKEEAYQKLGEEEKNVHLKHVKEVIEKFKRDLETFAAKYKDKISEDPVFRRQFLEMCTKIGVDPLVSSKNFWSEVFGFGDYYYSLAVKISRLAMESRASHGGLIAVQELIEKLKATSTIGMLDNVSEDDVRRAISSLSVLGNGFRIVELGDRKIPYLVTVSINFSEDHESILSLCQEKGYVNVEMCENQLGWETARFTLVTDTLLKQGLVWVDIHEGMWNFYIPAVMYGIST